MLYVHRSERADLLVEELAELVTVPLTDAMATEVVAVPTRGVERWLTQRLSHRLGTAPDRADGVCANVAFPFPGTVVAEVTAAATGVDPGSDPWPPERAVWPLVELIDAHLGDDFLAPLRAHLEGSAPKGSTHLRRFRAARRVADLYDRYAVHRPDMVLAWAAGQEGVEGSHADRRWQAELWRRLRDRLGVPSPAERFSAAAGRLAADPELSALPHRLSLFGLTRLPASHLDVLDGLAVGRDVHLFLLHPSGALWDKVAADLGPTGPAPARRDDRTAQTGVNPLLASWGRDAREMQVVLHAHPAAGTHRPVGDAPSTLLGRVQADVRADRAPVGAPVAGEDLRPVLAHGDDSLAVHSCHGPDRQVEVARDAILHALAADPTLEARDVLVMCPDIEAFAPLVQAVFGGGDDEEASPPDLRVRLADRSLRQTNPLLGVAAALLELAGSRLSAPQVVDFVSREPVRRRFGLDDDAVGRLEGWVGAAGVRWGLDGEHRAAWRVGGLDANTWAAGTDRLLLGVAMADEDQRLFAGTAPLDDVAGADVELAGIFAEIVSRMRAAVSALGRPAPVADWLAALADGVESLASAAQADRWQHDQLRRVLGDVGDAAGRSPVPLDRQEVQSLLAERLRGRPTTANFRTGDLTFCTLVPMRSVPHRVVVLLGLDESSFPRRASRDGDDLLLAEPRVGDRDAASEDRQLLLDALLSATEKLVVVYSGRDERTNQPRPPAVPVAELLDVVDATVQGATGAPARDTVVVQHPLQAFAPVNFTPGAVSGSGPWSFDVAHLAAARALNGPSAGPAPFLPRPLDPLPAATVELAALIRFVTAPVDSFLRERVGLRSPGEDPGLEDCLPLELDPLARWAVGDRLLSAVLAGADMAAAVEAERARGSLPPASLANAVLATVSGAVERLSAAARAESCWATAPESVQVSVDLAGGRRLTGTVPGVRGNTVLRCVYSRLGAKHRLTAWVQLLALTICRPEEEWTAVTIGQAAGRNDNEPARVARLRRLGGTPDRRAEKAAAHLDTLLDLYDRGMREPLPLFCNTSAAWVEAIRAEKNAVAAATKAWGEGAYSRGESNDAASVAVYGVDAPFARLLESRPEADECGPAWDEGQDTRFGRLAMRLWDGPLAYEALSR